jgi:hypothetical protein
VRTTTTDEDGGADAAVTGVAGALLLVDLAIGAGYGRPLFGGTSALAAGRQLRDHDLVKELLLHLGREDFVSELDLAHFLALQVEYIDFCHDDSGEG